MGNYFCGITVLDIFVHSQHFEKAFCQAGKANIQDYTPVQNTLAVIFLHTDYYAEIANILFLCCMTIIC